MAFVSPPFFCLSFSLSLSPMRPSLLCLIVSHLQYTLQTHTHILAHITARKKWEWRTKRQRATLFSDSFVAITAFALAAASVPVHP